MSETRNLQEASAGQPATSTSPRQSTAVSERRETIRGHARGTGRWAGAIGGNRLLPVAASLIVIAVVFEIQSQYFLTPRNLSNLAEQVATIALIALGEVFVLLLGEIDLSLGSIAGFCAGLLAVTLTVHGYPWWAALLLMLAAGAAIGTLQGSLIAYLRIPSFMVTLAGMLAWLGAQLLILGSVETVSISAAPILAIMGDFVPAAVAWVIVACIAAYVAAMLGRASRRGSAALLAAARQYLLGLAALVATVAVLNTYQGVPVAAAVVIAIVAAAWFLITRTRFGAHLLAVGGNAEAAFRAAVNIRRVRLAAFALAGLLGAMGGLMSASYEQSAGTLTGGGTLLLEAIGAAVIGGTSLFGGSGSAWSAIAGGLVLESIANGLDLTNEGAPVKYIIEGAVVLLAVVADRYLRRGSRAFAR